MSDAKKIETTAKEIAENIKLGAQVRADAEAEESGKIDKLLEAVGALGTSFKNMSDRIDAMEAKKDSADDDKEPEKKEPEKKDDDEGEARADSAALRSKLTAAQVRADSVLQIFGQSAKPPMNGETERRYRNRLVAPLSEYSPAWKGVDLATLPEDVFEIAEGTIYADSAAFAASPTSCGEGELREIVKIDASGRRISEFVGEPISWMAQFMGPRQRLLKISKTPFE